MDYDKRTFINDFMTMECDYDEVKNVSDSSSEGDKINRGLEGQDDEDFLLDLYFEIREMISTGCNPHLLDECNFGLFKEFVLEH